MTCATQPKPVPSHSGVTYACSLEAQSLISRFLQHPPAGFDARLSDQGVP
ncbi:GNAT family N-acetyltransferase, partial [Corynebacterium pseudodiphtheriticum]